MKTLINTLGVMLLAVLATSCVTGGFNDNPQLDELEDALAKAPSIEMIKANGEEVKRNTHSIREISAKVGDVVKLEAELTSGKGADLVELEFYRQYYGRIYAQEDPLPVDSLTDGFYDISGKSMTFSYDYTIPTVDDGGHDFEDGNIITIQYRVKNSLENYGYKSLVIEIEVP